MAQTWARKTHKTEVGLDLQAESLKALNWLNSEFAETTEDGVLDETATADPGIVFASPRDLNGRVRLDPSGRLLWQKYVCFYTDTLNGDPVLMMKVRPIASATTDPGSPPSVVDMKSDSTLERRVIARNITSFTGDPDNLSPWEITLEASAKSGRSRLGIRVQTSIFFRN